MEPSSHVLKSARCSRAGSFGPLFRGIRFVLIAAFIGLLVLIPGLSARAQFTFYAEINKSFDPINIVSGGISRLSVTVFNPNAFQLEDTAWTDNLVGVQPGIVIANPANVSNSCGGTVTAVPGTTTLALSGGTVPAQSGITPGSCTVAIDVTSITPGNLINTIPAFELEATGDGNPVTNSTPASATLRVGVVQPPSLSKGFSPNTMWIGEVSELRINILNNDQSTALTAVSVTDNLPTNVSIVGPAATPLTNCGAGASLAAPSGGSAITLSGATIAPGTTCVVRVNVTSLTPDTYTNTIPAGAIQTQQGTTNGSPATAPLNVQAVSISKAFSPGTFQAGDTSTLTITLRNPTGSPYTGVILNDDLPTSPNNNLVYVPGSASSTCREDPGSPNPASIPSERRVRLEGGYIPAGTPASPGTCTITVQVTTPAGAGAATYTNTIPARTMTTDQGVTNVLPASAQVGVYAFGTGVTGSKSFSPTTIDPNASSRLRVIINAPPGVQLTNFSITDNLPAGLTISNSSPATSTAGCGAGRTLTAVTGATSFSLTGGTINPGTACQIDVWVTGSTPDSYQNVIPPANISNDQNRRPAGNIQATLTIRAPVVQTGFTMSKAFFPTTVNPLGVSTLTIQLQNTNTSALVDVLLLDTLPGSGNTAVRVASAPHAHASTTCGGTLTAVPGTQAIQLQGGTIPAQVGAVPGICTITVNVQGSVSTGNRDNTIPVGNVSGRIEGTSTVVSPMANATARLTVANISIGVVKKFDPLTVFGGSASTLTVELINPTSVWLVGIAFEDIMPAGMIIANPPNLNTGTCGGTLVGVPETGSFSFSGGSLPPSGTCELTLSTTMTVNGNLTNVIPAGAVTTTNGASNPQPAEASLTNLPGASISKFFAPNPAYAGSQFYSLLTIRIQNTGNVELTSVGFIDNLPGILPAGLQVAGGSAPAPVNNCGGTLTAVPGSQVIQLADGVVPGSSSCTMVIAVTGSTPGDYQNIIPAGALTNTQGTTNTQPAQDTLTLEAILSPELDKGFDPGTVAVGRPSEMAFTLTNPNTVPLTNISFSDPLPANLDVDGPFGGTCSGSFAVEDVAGTTTLSISGVNLAAGPDTSCTITLPVISSVAGVYQNVTSAVTSNETPDGPPAQAELTVFDTLAMHKVFAPPEVAVGEVATLTFTLFNPFNVTMVNVQFFEFLPLGSPAGQMQVASPANPTTSGCGPAVVWDPQPGDIDLTFSGGTIAPQGQCIVTVDVVGSEVATYVNQVDPAADANLLPSDGSTPEGPIFGGELETEPGVRITGQRSNQTVLAVREPDPIPIPIPGGQSLSSPALFDPATFPDTLPGTGGRPVMPVAIPGGALVVALALSGLALAILRRRAASR